jgi:hypothetical protein
MGLALKLAKQARRIALVQVVRSHPELTIEHLDALLTNPLHGDELSRISIDELLAFRHPLIPRARGPTDETILRVFKHRRVELSSGFFVRYLGLERWTAQQRLARLAERGLLVRSGKTSSTRYALPERAQTMQQYVEKSTCAHSQNELVVSACARDDDILP